MNNHIRTVLLSLSLLASPVLAQVGTKPVETKPADNKPVETKPVETKPAETKPATKPADGKPAEAKPEGKSADAKPSEAKDVLKFVRFETSMGAMLIELNETKAPITTANFIAYVNDGHYVGTIFHRVVSGFVIQGGGMDASMREKATKAPIRNEWRNGLKNSRGSLSMARTSDPDSATSQFFVNLADNAALDVARVDTGNAGYAVFGRVVQGMDVVDKIAATPRNGQTPRTAIVINAAKLLTQEEADKALGKETKEKSEPAKEGDKKPEGKPEAKPESKPAEKKPD